MSRNTQLIKRLRKNYTYTAQQLYEQFGVHPQTLRTWSKDSNQPLKLMAQRPTLIFSEDLRDYLSLKVKHQKTSLESIQLYCLACRERKQPYQKKVAFVPKDTRTYMRAICPTCYRLMSKAQSTAKLAAATPLVERISLEDLHILSRTILSEKTHLSQSCKNRSRESLNGASPTEQLVLI